MNKFFNFTIKRSAPLLFIGLFISFLGIKAFTVMPRSLFPEVNYPRVVIEVNMGYMPLQVMEWGITSILEKELRSVPGVRLVKSVTSRGLSTIDVFLRESEEVTLAVQRVNAKIAEVRSLLPVGAQISVRPITAAAFPSAEYCFTSSKKNSRDLRNFVEYTIRPLVMVVPGIFNTKVIGGDLPEYSVELDPRKLALTNLTISDISDRLKNSNSLDFLGPVQHEGTQTLAFGGKFAHSVEDIQNIIVDSSLGRSIKIGDLGRVELRNEFKIKSVSLNGTECVGLDVFYQNGIDQNATSKQVSSTVGELMRQNPDEAFLSWDLNDFTIAATSAVLIDLAVGMFIIAAITLLFLRSFKYSAIALLTMPLAASFTFLMMSHLGLTVNLMTLGGLTAAIGLVVDNTVIILEMYHHKRLDEPDQPKAKLIQDTLVAVCKPMIFGTATIALVFTPISYLSGISGMFFSPMAHVHTSALSLSVFLALFLVPGLILLFDRNSKKPSENILSKSPKQKSFEMGRFAAGYKKLLTFLILKSRYLALILLIIPLLGLLLITKAKTGFLPEWDEGDLIADFRAITPLSLEATVEKLKPFENYLKKDLPELDFFVRKVGTALGEYNKAPYSGEIVIRLKKNRKRSVFEIRDQLAGEVDKIAEGLEFDFFQILPDRLNDLSGSSKPIVLNLRGGDDIKLDELSKIYKDELSKINGLDSVRITDPEKAAEIIFNIDERRSRALDLNPSTINENVRFGIFSLDTSSVQLGAQSIPIRLRSLQQSQHKISSLEDVSIFTSKGGLEKIGRLGHIENVKSRIESSHIDGVPVRTITAELADRDLGSVVKDIKSTILHIQSSEVVNASASVSASAPAPASASASDSEPSSAPASDSASASEPSSAPASDSASASAPPSTSAPPSVFAHDSQVTATPAQGGRINSKAAPLHSDPTDAIHVQRGRTASEPMQSGRITAAPVGGRTTSELIRTQGGRTTAELAGDYQLQQKSFKELIVAFLTGLLLIFITALLFSNRFSIAIPLTFCSLVPPTIGLLGCILFRIPLDVSSFSGLISVTGIAVANCFMALSAIESNFDHDNTSTPHSNLTTDSTSPTKSASKKITVATTCFNHTGESNLRNETRLSDAKNSPLHGSSGIIKGMLSRLRPILMTNLAAMAGFIPIAIGLSSGDEILRPFSIAVISGLFGALYTTLILFPLFYRHFASVPFQKS